MKEKMLIPHSSTLQMDQRPLWHWWVSEREGENKRGRELNALPINERSEKVGEAQKQPWSRSVVLNFNCKKIQTTRTTDSIISLYKYHIYSVVCVQKYLVCVLLLKTFL